MKKYIILFAVVAAIIGFSFFKYRETNHSDPVPPVAVTPVEPNKHEQIPAEGALDYEEAMIRAAKDGKKVFVYFSADWCVWCKKMQADTLSQPNMLTGYHYARIDSDKRKDLVRKYGVHGLPSYYVVSADGKVLRQGSGYKNPAEFQTWLSGTLRASQLHWNDE